MRPVAPASTHNDDVETLLTRAGRARLPLRRLVHLYLDPFALFKDLSRGPASVRQRAPLQPRHALDVAGLYPPLGVIAASSFLGIASAEALAAQASLFILPAAAFAVGGCIGLVVIVCTATVYLLLGR